VIKIEWICKDCGNDEEFLADAELTDTAIVNSKGKFIDWSFGGSAYEDPYIKNPHCCKKCHSENIVIKGGG